MDKLISVVVPIYNAEKYLEKCIESILNQSYTNLELILVNDGSKDNSKDICGIYTQKDCRVKYIEQENQGVSVARNTGINNASGEFVIFIDGDDYIKENLISNLFNSQIKNDADYVFSGIENCYMRDGEVINVTVDIPRQAELQIKEFLSVFEEYRRFLSSPCKSLYKLSIIKENDVKFPINVHIGEDKIFVSNYLYYSKSVNAVAQAGYVYIIATANTLSSKNTLSVPTYNFNSAEYRTKMFEENGFDVKDREYAKQFYDTLIFNFIRVYSKRLGYTKKQKFEYSKSVCKDPTTNELAKKYKGINKVTKILRFCIVNKLCRILHWMLSLYLKKKGAK